MVCERRVSALLLLCLLVNIGLQTMGFAVLLRSRRSLRFIDQLSIALMRIWPFVTHRERRKDGLLLLLDVLYSEEQGYA